MNEVFALGSTSCRHEAQCQFPTEGSGGFSEAGDGERGSQNGIANIFYYLFGLGDPNGANIDSSRLPAIATGGPANRIAFSYLRPEAGSTGMQIDVLTSSDLSH